MNVCHICDKEFRDRYNLRRHVLLKHNEDIDEEYSSSYENESEDADDAMSDDDDQNQSEGSGEESDEEAASDGENSSDDTDSESDEDEPFRRIIDMSKVQLEKENTENSAPELDSTELKERLQKIFRRQYKDTLLWMYRLKRNATHKKIMDTAKEFRDERNYDYEESVESSISTRKHLLKRLFENLDDDEMETE